MLLRFFNSKLIVNVNNGETMRGQKILRQGRMKKRRRKDARYMQFGLCVNMIATDEQGIGMQHLPMLKQAGFDFVEIPVMHSMRLDRASFTEKVVRPYKDSGLACRAMNSYCGPDLPLIGEGADEAKIDTYIKESMERAAMLGASCVVFGGGVARMRPFGMAKETAAARLAEVFIRMAKEAEPCGVTVCIEPLNRQETNHINLLEEAWGMMGQVGRENVRLLVDYFHFTLGNEPIASLAAHVADIAHVHFARMMGRVLPQERDEDEGYQVFMDTLVAGGYEGGFSLEAFCKADAAQEAKGALALMRTLYENSQAR
jgi:D-psicose/D-tagatose/L-ribulose 3-epimerase